MRLFFDNAPSAGWVDSFLVFLDVERPGLIEVATEVSGSELDDGLGHSLGPAHARSLHAVLNQVLAGTFHHWRRLRREQPRGLGAW